MIDLSIHFHGNDAQRVKMPCLPRAGEYIVDGGKTWKISAVVHNAASTTWGKAGVSLFCMEVAGDHANELGATWAGWSETATVDR
jgi:hypothetical protein